jgi:hypothetical protein
MAVYAGVFHRSGLASFVRGCTLCAATLFSFELAAVSAHSAIAQVAVKTTIDDTWQGTLHVQKDLRLVLKIERGPDGTLKSTFYSIDQTGQPFPVKQTTFASGELKLNVDVIGGEFT